MRRVVVTGLGLVSPLGVGVETNWARLVSGESGVDQIQGFDASDLNVTIAAEVPIGEGSGRFNAHDWLDPKEQRKNEKFIIFAVAAASQAIRDSGLDLDAEREQVRSGAQTHHQSHMRVLFVSPTPSPPH